MGLVTCVMGMRISVFGISMPGVRLVKSRGVRSVRGEASRSLCVMHGIIVGLVVGKGIWARGVSCRRIDGTKSTHASE